MVYNDAKQSLFKEYKTLEDDLYNLSRFVVTEKFLAKNGEHLKKSTKTLLEKERILNRMLEIKKLLKSN